MINLNTFEKLIPEDPSIEWVTIASKKRRWLEPSMIQLIENRRLARSKPEWRFYREYVMNRMLYELFVEEVLADIDRGAEHGSPRFYYHLLRWKQRRRIREAKGSDLSIHPIDKQKLALTDQTDAYMARLFEELNPQYMGFFRKLDMNKSVVAGPIDLKIPETRVMEMAE